MADPSGRRVPAALRDLGHPAVVVAIVAGCVVALGARFVVSSPLWLDEALSVNIASLPLGDIGEALRHDGHPPLYYVLLHVWMAWFGSGDLAVRALSGVISLGVLPLAYRAGGRLGGPRMGWMTVAVLSLSPYFLRYGSETRMYSLVMLLVLGGYLCGVNALERPRLGWLAGVTTTTAALLWTHYWSIWLLVATGALLLVRLWRHRATGLDRRAATVLGAMAAGAVLFLPWVPSMLYQAQHTGTPWAKPFRPANLVVQSLTDFNGGPYGEPQVLMMLTVLLLAIGVFGRGIDDWRVELDFHTQPDSRVPSAILATTVVIASMIGLVTRSTFSPRYASVFFPFFVLLVALGLDHFKGRITRNVVLSVFLLLSMVGLFVVFRFTRTQAGAAAEAIERYRPASAIVATCPDQYGPALDRAIGGRWPIVTYPRFGSPKRVDWVDYAERNRASDPKAFAEELLRRAGDRTIFLAFANSYRTLGNKCSDLLTGLSESRPPQVLVQAEPDSYYEAMTLYVLPAPAR